MKYRPSSGRDRTEEVSGSSGVDRPETLYRTIVADPPWDIREKSPGGGGGAGPDWASGMQSRSLVYPTLTVAEIAALDVPSAPDAHLYLWTINAHVESAYKIARAWGFRPSTLLVWCKAPNGLGLGGTYSLTTEFVLFARRGSLRAEQRIATTWFRWSRGRHSQKPEAFLDIVESVSPGPYLELFARRNRLGWDTWGNEAFQHVDLPFPEVLEEPLEEPAA